MWLSGTGKSRFVEALAHLAIEQDLRVARLVPLIRIVRLLAEHSTVARRWLSSVATRVVRSHDRILGLLRKSLSAQGVDCCSTKRWTGASYCHRKPWR